MSQVSFLDCKISKFAHEASAYAIDSLGKVYAWGWNTQGQLGHGDIRNRKMPTQIQSLKRKQITQIAIGN